MSPNDPLSEAWTIGRLLSWTADYLKRKGSESPRLDAEVMLAHVLKRQRVELYTHFNDEVAEPARKGFRDLVQSRASGFSGGLSRGPKGVFLARPLRSRLTCSSRDPSRNSSSPNTWR